MLKLDNRASPFPLIHLILVQVSSQAILVGTEGLVSSVDVDRSGPGVKDAAVAVASLNQGPDRVQYGPRVPGWGEKSQHKRVNLSVLMFEMSFYHRGRKHLRHTGEDHILPTLYSCTWLM